MPLTTSISLKGRSRGTSFQYYTQGSRPNEKRTGTLAFMASAGARAITGVWGRSPQWGPGAKPLVRGSGGREAPLKLKTF